MISRPRGHQVRSGLPPPPIRHAYSWEPPKLRCWNKGLVDPATETRRDKLQSDSLGFVRASSAFTAARRTRVLMETSCFADLRNDVAALQDDFSWRELRYVRNSLGA